MYRYAAPLLKYGQARVCESVPKLIPAAFVRAICKFVLFRGGQTRQFCARVRDVKFLTLMK